MAGFVQALFTGQSKAPATSLAITGSLTVTVGNFIVVAFGADDVGSAFGCTDNLTNTYTLQKTQVNAGQCKALLFAAPITTGGTLTTITVSWTTNVTAKAAASAEFSDVGTLRLTDGVGGAGVGINSIQSNTFFTNELWVGAHCIEDDVVPTTSGTDGTPTQTLVDAGGNGTTGGGTASNISVNLGYILISADSSVNAALDGSSGTGSQDYAGAGAIFNAAAAAAPRVPRFSVYPQLLAH